MTILAPAALVLAATAVQTLYIGWLPPGRTPAEQQAAARPLERYLAGKLAMPVKVVTAPS
jgi:hypothetical protein